MKRFLNTVLAFLLVLTMVLLVSALFYGHYKKQYLQDKNLNLGLNNNTLIVGDSHAETSFDDNIIPNSRNIAFHAEHYLFTYFKLKYIIKANPQIENVILSYGPHNLSQGADVTLFSLGRNSRSFARYFMLLDQEGVDDTYSPTQNWRINYLKWKLNIPFQLKLEGKLLYKTVLNKHLGLNDFPFIGKFYASSKHVFNDVAEPINGHYFKNGKILQASNLSLKYLYKIIALCEANNIKLILINTPLHQEYRNRIPEYFIKLYTKTTSEITSKHPSVQILDYSELTIPDNAFGDYHHVNSIGAKLVSERLLSDLN
jgi:hypothetical protein